MILREEMPQELRDKFLSQFGKSFETYWDPFWGWKDHQDQFEKDFPTLTRGQQEVIDELVALEKEQFEEIVRIANIQLEVAPRLCYMPVAKQEAIKAKVKWLPMEE